MLLFSRLRERQSKSIARQRVPTHIMYGNASDVLDHFQPETTQAHQLARRAEHAQLVHAKVGQHLHTCRTCQHTCQIEHFKTL